MDKAVAIGNGHNVYSLTGNSGSHRLGESDRIQKFEGPLIHSQNHRQNNVRMGALMVALIGTYLTSKNADSVVLLYEDPTNGR